MAAQTIGTLAVGISANTSELARGLQKGAQDIDSFERNLRMRVKAPGASAAELEQFVKFRVGEQADTNRFVAWRNEQRAWVDSGLQARALDAARMANSTGTIKQNLTDATAATLRWGAALMGARGTLQAMPELIQYIRMGGSSDRAMEAMGRVPVVGWLAEGMAQLIKALATPKKDLLEQQWKSEGYIGGTKYTIESFIGDVYTTRQKVEELGKTLYDKIGSEGLLERARTFNREMERLVARLRDGAIAVGVLAGEVGAFLEDSRTRMARPFAADIAAMHRERRERAGAMTLELRTDMERAQYEWLELYDLDLDPTTRARAQRRIASRLLSQQGTPSSWAGAALERGSAAEYTARIEAGVARDVKKIQERQLDAMLQQLRQLIVIAGALTRSASKPRMLSLPSEVP